MRKLQELVSKLFVNSTNNLLTQLFRYVFVGGIAFVVDFGLLFVLTEYLHLYYIVSATISFIAGLLTNYLLATAWIFKNPKIKNRTGEFIAYALIGVVGLLLNNAILYLLTSIIGIYYLLSKIITAAIVMLYNFFGRRLLYRNK